MARFRAVVQGGRGGASRLGHTQIEARADGWSCGVSVYGHPDKQDPEADAFDIYATEGSGSSATQYLGTVRLVNGRPRLEVAT